MPSNWFLQMLRIPQSCLKWAKNMASAYLCFFHTDIVFLNLHASSNFHSGVGFQKCHFIGPFWNSCSTGLALGGLGYLVVGGSLFELGPRILRRRPNCWLAHQAAPSDQAAVSMWHPAKTTGQQPPQNNNVENFFQFLELILGNTIVAFRRKEEQMRTLQHMKGLFEMITTSF